jgi:uncharacterized BrkB/YihY/UPF0761 family membrane protein
MMAVVFLFLSLDEVAQIHEKFGWLLPEQFDDLPINTWIIIGVPIAAAVGIVFMPFLRRLPRRVLLGIVLSAAVFLTGAVVAETMSGMVYYTSWRITFPGFTWARITVAEEWLEMLGVILLIATLRGHRRALLFKQA